MLDLYIKKQLETKEILLMTHIVMGYPSFEDSYNIVEQMVTAGVDLMELQIPFSEPMADGPVILKANQSALENGSTVEKCFKFAQKVSADFNIPFLFMSYANILYQYGMEKFSDKMLELDIKGAIVPFPYLARCRKATNLPIAVGFGVKDKADVNYLKSSHKQLVIYRTTIICQAVYANIRHL